MRNAILVLLSALIFTPAAHAAPASAKRLLAACEQSTSDDDARSRACRELLERFPNADRRERADAMIALGYLAKKNGDLVEMERWYSEAIKAQPTEDWNDRYRIMTINTWIADALAEHGKPEAALKYYEVADSMDPKSIDLPLWRSAMLRQLGRYDEALRLCDDHVAKFPTVAKGYFERAEVNIARGDHRAALPDLDQAVERAHVFREEPKRGSKPTYLNARGNVLVDLGEYDRAIEDFSAAIALDPTVSNGFSNRGSALMKAGRHTQALPDFKEAIRLDPKNPLPHKHRCRALTLLGEAQEAIADCDEAIRLQPDYAGAFVNRAMAYEALGKQQRAIADYRAAAALPVSWFAPAETAAEAKQRLSALTTSAPAASSAASLAAHPAPAPTAPTGPRVALVIGNSGYASVPRLPNPQRDAGAVADSLRRLGFKTVRAATDLGAEAMRRALIEFGREASAADWAVVYFAGHGIEVGGRNYLIPVDARLAVDRDVEFEAISLDQVLTSVEGAKKLRVVILDACRDNPFAAQMSRTTASRSIGRGLARVEPDGATLVVYAAKGGQIALDGDGAASPFATSLLRNIEQPGVEIRWLFSVVRDEVLAATGRRQEPFTYGSLPAEKYYFNPKGAD